MKKQMSFRSSQVWLGLALWLSPASLALAQGTIAYLRPAQPLYLRGAELDLNGDGQMDCRFYDGSTPTWYFATAASGVGTARLLVTPQGLFDLGSDLVALDEGFLIGSSLNPTLFWAAPDAPNLYGKADVLGVFMTDQGDVIPAGYFYGRTAFMGIHFQIGSVWHYGWVQIRGGVLGDELSLFPPAWILDWAYETRPNTPIFAGQVPEPSSAVLFFLGVVVVVAQQRRKSL